MLKPNVLRRKKDFSAIYKKGKSIGDKYVVLFYRKNNSPYNRISFLASKKVGNSVKRNRARRLMKESFRQICHKLNSEHYDMIIIARNTINDLKCADVKESMEAAMRRVKLITNKKNGEI